MNTSNSSKGKDPRFTKTIWNDFKQLKLKEDIGSEYKDLKEYYLDEDRKKRLETMGGCRKLFLIPWWLLKSLFFRLTPFRRILLLLSIFLLFLSGNNRIESGTVTLDLFGPGFIGGLILLFILAMELKDKLLAKTELEEGKSIQQALMPQRKPVVEGWDIWLFTKSANDVGGDLIDFIQLDVNRYAIAVGDVAGKGLSAALLMAKLQSTIRALVPDYTSLSLLGEKINKIFFRDSLPKIFASLVYLEFEKKSGLIKILNAGHIPPVIFKDRDVRQMDKNSPALGIMKDAKFEERSIILEKDETMIIYSDGLNEAQNEAGEFFGDERLKNMLVTFNDYDSETTSAKILQAVETFIMKVPVHDDLTIAILRKTS